MKSIAFCKRKIMLLLMQLFLVDQRTRKGDQIFLTDIPEILSQLRKVLRMKKGDVFWLQQKTGASARYQIQICEWTDTSLSGKLIQTQAAPPSCPAVEMLIALPNKREKAEWVTQKLTEIGIKKLFFWPAERSVIKVWNAHKAQRLRKIAQEALEQSRGWELPQIAFLSVQELSCLESSSVFFFDQDEKASCSALTLSPQVFSAQQGVRGIIGPEGWFTEQDYRLFPQHTVLSLWSEVLRMETAAIIGAWVLKQRFLSSFTC